MKQKAKGNNNAKSSTARIFSRIRRAANETERDSTAMTTVFWWLCLWSIYVGTAALEPVLLDQAEHMPGSVLLFILAIMAVMFVLELSQGWEGVLLMNCLISIPIVPGLFIWNVLYMVISTNSWTLKARLGFLGVQAMAVVLTGLHFLFTKKNGKTCLRRTCESRAHIL